MKQIVTPMKPNPTSLSRRDFIAAAMAAFSRPVPDYEPGFQHQRHLTASATVLRNRPSL